MDDLLSGLVMAVSAAPVGTQLAAGAGTGATVLLVDDAIDFQPTGGQVTFGGAVVDYVSADDDASTVTLAVPLVAEVDEGAELLVYPPRVEMTALVVTDETSDPIPAVVPVNWQDALPVGVREEEDREKVRLTRDGEWSWAIHDLPGKPLDRDAAFLALPRINAWLPTAFPIPTSTNTLISGWAWEEQGGWVPGGAGEFVCPKTGNYLVIVGARWDSNDIGRRVIWAETTNGDGVTEAGFADTRPGQAIAGMSTQAVQPWFFEEGDLVRFWALQSSGAELNLRAGNTQTVFTVTWIGQ